MKLYKEKYGASKTQTAQTGSKKPADRKKPDALKNERKSYSAKKPVDKKYNQKNGKPVIRQQKKTETASVEAKKGLFSKLASIFKKK